ncbi:CDP-glycerol glycerophosphotransferase family protein [Shigella sonnei]|uniref:CDP-glycerol glycerophosphotransferase family protein n=1 Tax=Shigella sonnei TaxID=624 RepID=UPI002485A233|nr:CDP-glycerol glycerophosphotransferase family protein [Shigella sonnei]MDI2120760.1 CDP-glycerol glycerophosphotransferase family protein [Shigella sonnei]
MAIKDINILSKTLEKNNLCLIIKLHPEISNDFYFKTLQKQVGQYRNIIFWDNKNDIYEIFNKIDLAIIDYSSIYYDLVSAGVKNFIRYIFDFDDEKHIMLYDYQSHTSGKMCQSFGELINAIDEYQTYSDNNLEK